MRTDVMEQSLERFSLKQKASLLSGKDGWTTKSIPENEVASLMMIDGPHGLRRPGPVSDHLGLTQSLTHTQFAEGMKTIDDWRDC